MRFRVQEVASQNNDVNISSHTKHSYVSSCVSERIKQFAFKAFISMILNVVFNDQDFRILLELFFCVFFE